MGIKAQAFAGLTFLVLVLATALFVPARTLQYWQAWVFLAVFAAATTAITIDLGRRDPALLARRVQAGPVAEKKPVQKVIQGFATIAFLATFIVSALDRRMGWSRLPTVLVLAGDGLVALGLFIVFRVFRANTFTSATIEVAPEQHVVSHGPYAVVRHPMYAGALVMMIGVPIALGSAWGLVALPALATVIVWRLLDEETHLGQNLAGYEAYRKRVAHRLVPWVW
jgi:protein-S-isoprenylcysteine O-methyltransferase Ste14